MLIDLVCHLPWVKFIFQRFVCFMLILGLGTCKETFVSMPMLITDLFSLTHDYKRVEHLMEILNNPAGVGWSRVTGNHFLTCQRNAMKTRQGEIHVHPASDVESDPILTWPPKPYTGVLFNNCRGASWSPWDDDVCLVGAESKMYYTGRTAIDSGFSLVAVNVNRDTTGF